MKIHIKAPRPPRHVVLRIRRVNFAKAILTSTHISIYVYRYTSGYTRTFIYIWCLFINTKGYSAAVYRRGVFCIMSFVVDVRAY